MAKVVGILGNGIDTVFDVPVGAITSDAVAQLADVPTNQEIIGFGLERQVPDNHSVRLTLTPAPETGSVRYVITDGSEKF